MSESPSLKDQAYHFKAILNCKTEYLGKGEFKKYPNGKTANLPAKNSVLTITSYEEDYNSSVMKILSAYEGLLSYFNQIQYDAFINLSYYSNDMISLEFSPEVLSLLSKYNFSLPISCYHNDG
jgi:hypothetical protein